MIDHEQLQQLYRYGIALTGDPEFARDLLQSAIEKSIQRPPSQNNPSAYWRAVMRNEFIDQCRREQKVAFEPLSDDTPLILDEQSLEQQQIDRDLVDRLLAELNVAEREILFLWAVLEYSASEIAAELNIPRGTVLSRLFRVKKKAQTLLAAFDTPTSAMPKAAL